MSSKQELDFEAYKAEGKRQAQEFIEKRDELYEKYPDYYDADEIECLDLIMKREFAEAIIRGEKKVEFRAYTEKYENMLFDEEVLKFMEEHLDDPLVQECADALKEVKTIRFRNYNKSWELVVECEVNDIIIADKESVWFLQEQYGCHELDEVYEQTKKSRKKNVYFYFVIGKILKRENI